MYFCNMEKFDVHILGCGSALPTLRHWPSSQLINLREKLFMIDCGEGAQVQFRRSRQKFSRLSHIFISHLHGDHIFGLIGLLSTLSLAGRTLPMHLYAHAELEPLLRAQLNFFCNGIDFEVVFMLCLPMRSLISSLKTARWGFIRYLFVIVCPRVDFCFGRRRLYLIFGVI